MLVEIENEEVKSERAKKFYFDTSIWLDFFENRDEPNLPKSKIAKELVKKIVENNDKILLSDVNYKELNKIGYSRYDIKELLLPIRKSVGFIISTGKQIGRARDLAVKRDIPSGDALQAFLARDNRAVLITRDNHFKKILDIIVPYLPEEFI